MPHQVLIYGHDSLLLKTRELLLRQAGFDVCAVDRTDTIHGILSTRCFDLLILCYSVDFRERSAILAAARASQKNLAVLLLISDYREPSVPDNVAVFRTVDGPRDFLRTVCRLTHEATPDPFLFNFPNPGKDLCQNLQAR